MKWIDRWSIPPDGTRARDLLEKRLAADGKNPEVKKRLKGMFKKAIARCEIQMENGAQLPADSLLREYNGEYNNRVLSHSLNDLPGSFNVVEAFNRFDPSLSLFFLRKEVDHIFSFGDFLDFFTSDAFAIDVSEAMTAIEEDVVYSFNSTDDPRHFLFSTESDEEFGVRAISLIKHGSEIAVMLLGGQVCDLAKETESLQSELVEIKRIRNIRPDSDAELVATPLEEGKDLWRTIVLTRFDIESSSTDARYIYKDAGNSYLGHSDDPAMFLGISGHFESQELEEIFKAGVDEIERHGSLFEVCKLAIHLPLFARKFEDAVSVQRHQTVFGEKRAKASYQRTAKLAPPSMKIAYRDVYKISDSDARQPAHRRISTPNLKVSTSGYWKKLDFGDVGVDRNGGEVQGRTWVSKTLEWRESGPTFKSVSVKSRTPNERGKNHGFVYVMRSAAHGKDIFKVGLTRRSSDVRSSELTATTSSPDHFLVVQEWEVSDCALAEEQIHDLLANYRINPKREYFRAPYREIFRVIDRVIESIDGVQTDGSA